TPEYRPSQLDPRCPQRHASDHYTTMLPPRLPYTHVDRRLVNLTMRWHYSGRSRGQRAPTHRRGPGDGACLVGLTGERTTPCCGKMHSLGPLLGLPLCACTISLHA